MTLILIGLGAAAAVTIWSLLAAASKADQYNEELARIFNEEWEIEYDDLP